MQDGKYFRTGIDGQPEPEDLFGSVQPGAQFVQLDIRKLEMTEKMLMEDVSVLPCAGQPADDCRLTVAEDPLGGGRVQAFGQSRQDHGDLVRGSLQPVQWGVASGTERGVAGLTPKRLDPLCRAMLAIPNQGMNLGVGDPEVQALLVGTGVAVRVNAFRSTSSTFHFTPGKHRRRPCTRRGRRGETTGRAIIWAAGLEQTGEPAALGPALKGGRPKREPVKPPQRQQERADHKQVYEHRKGHHDPRCLKWGERGEFLSLEERIKRVSHAVKPVGEKYELSTTMKRWTSEGT